MNFKTSVRLTLVVASDDHTIVGRLIDDAGGEHAFTGWVGLAQQLDRQLSAAAAAAPARPAGRPAPPL